MQAILAFLDIFKKCYIIIFYSANILTFLSEFELPTTGSSADSHYLHVFFIPWKIILKLKGNCGKIVKRVMKLV